jgi:hypothetical protein
MLSLSFLAENIIKGSDALKTAIQGDGRDGIIAGEQCLCSGVKTDGVEIVIKSYTK